MSVFIQGSTVIQGNTIFGPNINSVPVGNIDSLFVVGSGFNDGQGTTDPYDGVNEIKIQSDGKILIGGNFTQYSGVTSRYLIRLNSDGSRDTTFNVGTNFNSNFFGVYKISIQSDDKILCVGNFDAYSGISRNNIVRLNSDATLDNTFAVGNGFNQPPFSMALQTDGKILLGGGYTSYSGISVSGVIRLNTSGSYDNTFTSTFIGGTRAIAIQSDGKILCGGDTGQRLARLNTNGSTDVTFNVGSGFAGGTNIVYSIVIQSDEKILVGGSFTNYSGVTTNRIVRLNSNGSIDNTFVIGLGFDGPIYSIVIQSDGKILCGGNFTSYDGVPTNRIVRLNSNGSIDSLNFNPGFNDAVFSLGLQLDGKLLCGGDFTNYSGVTRNRIIRLILS